MTVSVMDLSDPGIAGLDESLRNIVVDFQRRLHHLGGAHSAIVITPELAWVPTLLPGTDPPAWLSAPAIVSPGGRGVLLINALLDIEEGNSVLANDSSLDTSGAPPFVELWPNVEMQIAQGRPEPWLGHLELDWQGHKIHVAGYANEYSGRDSPVFVGAAATREHLFGFFRMLVDLRLKKEQEISRVVVFSNEAKSVVRRPNLHWDDLVLPSGLSDLLRSNVESFFASRGLYEKYSIAYRRGILMVGPPGTGKTSVVKVILSQYPQFAAFVYGFGPINHPGYELSALMSRARSLAPALVVLEDVDRIAVEGLKREFLNLIDGLASPDGILIVATSNQPERLDPALLERPSRFDLVVRFDLPDAEQRRRYLESRLLGFEVAPEDIERLVAQTPGYTMAMLQEVRTGAILEAQRLGKAAGRAELDVGLARMEGSRQTARRIARGGYSGHVGIRKSE